MAWPRRLAVESVATTDALRDLLLDEIVSRVGPSPLTGAG
jgi:hypothetical protein